jgi:Predicted membrane protein
VPDSPSPTPPSDRILGLDVLRGFALLGILVINIQAFAMPFATLNNPTAYGDLTGANYLVWVVSHVLAKRKFITLFSLLFGAGIVLFARSKREDEATRLHYRRTAFLLAAGLAHAYLLWYGDILVPYAVCGLVVFFVRDWEPKLLARVGLLLIAVPALMYIASGVSLESTQAVLAQWNPSDAAVAAEIDTYRSGWLAQFDHRIPTAISQQTSGFVALIFWRTSGLMLWGMALFKWGVLSNERSAQFYRRLLAGGLLGGIPLILAGVWYNEAIDWSVRALFFGSQFNYWGSLLLAGAYIGGVMLFCRRFGGGFVTSALSAVGRTAFSNYILQTVIATTIFYGHGLGLFGRVSRVEQAGVVVAIWVVQIVLSVLWLRYFRFGPLEWLWRTVTYGERQPLRN